MYQGEITLINNDPTNNTIVIEVSGYGSIATEILNQVTNHFILFPNPTTDNVYIQISTDVEKVQMISFSGQVVLEQTTIGTKTEINTSALEPGIYFVKALSSNQVITRKLVIE